MKKNRRPPRRLMTPNQLVAYNLRRFREAVDSSDPERDHRSQTQAAGEAKGYLGEEWSRQRWSHAEASARQDARDDENIRGFTADEIVAFALTFDVPVTWFFLPPDEALPLGGNYRDPDVEVRVGTERIDVYQLLESIFEKRLQPGMMQRLEQLCQTESDGGVFPDSRGQGLADLLFDSAQQNGGFLARGNAAAQANKAREEVRALRALLERQEAYVSALEGFAASQEADTTTEDES